ncbi:hypothetical protein GOBAR_AA14606 [Gossypium barbadense]|uniref:Uncharacterized protein n=1 Tax=Gossypium barbadense TaxID=3634 RepID=A0A2P5XRQ7_GOSBA|nr:hypothetical protein GOBAR_AA14606 [Gossypium barbadense]
MERSYDSTNCLEYTNKVTNRVFEAQIPSSTRPITWLCLRPCDQHGGKHGLTLQSCKNRVDTGVGMEKHGRARGKARFCFFNMGVRHARAVKPWIAIHGRGRRCRPRLSRFTRPSH